MRLFFIILAMFTFSCNNQSEEDSSSEKIKSLYNNVDYESFVGVAAINPSESERISNLLHQNEIPNIIEGSVVYGISVPPNLKVKAIKLLKKDAESKKYYIKF